MDTAEWAQRKVDSIQAATARDSVRDELTLERQRIRTANFPDLVQAVIDSFRRHCDEYNKRRPARESRIFLFAHTSTVYSLKRDAGLSEMEIQVNFPACTLRITAHNATFSYSRTYRPLAMDDGSATLSFSDGQTKILIAAEEVARDATDSFLDGSETAVPM